MSHSNSEFVNMSDIEVGTDKNKITAPAPMVHYKVEKSGSGGELNVVEKKEVDKYDEEVTLIAKLFIKAACIETFDKEYTGFLKSIYENYPAHKSVTLIKEDATEKDGVPKGTKVVIAIHKFSSYSSLSAFSVSKLRNDWDKKMQPWMAKDPQFHSYSGVTSYFSVVHNFNLPEGRSPPPKWKIGLILFVLACAWGLILSITGVAPWVLKKFDPVGHCKEGEECVPDFKTVILLNVALTAVNLLPLFFVLLDLVLMALGCWVFAPAYRPQGDSFCVKLIRFLIFG